MMNRYIRNLSLIIVLLFDMCVALASGSGIISVRVNHNENLGGVELCYSDTQEAVVDWSLIPSGSGLRLRINYANPMVMVYDLLINGEDYWEEIVEMEGYCYVDFDADTDIEIDIRLVQDYFVNVEDGYLKYVMGNDFSVTYFYAGGTMETWSFPYWSGETTDVTITPYDGYGVKSLRDGDVDIDIPSQGGTVTLTFGEGDINLSVLFSSKKYRVDAVDQDGLPVNAFFNESKKESEFAECEPGTTVNMRPVERSGYQVVEVRAFAIANPDAKIVLTPLDGLYSVEVSGDMRFEVVYQLISLYELTFNDYANGSVSVTCDSEETGVAGHYYSNSRMHLAVTPDTGYLIGAIMVNGVNYYEYYTNGGVSFTIVDNTYVELDFVQSPQIVIDGAEPVGYTSQQAAGLLQSAKEISLTGNWKNSDMDALRLIMIAQGSDATLESFDSRGAQVSGLCNMTGYFDGFASLRKAYIDNLQISAANNIFRDCTSLRYVFLGRMPASVNMFANANPNSLKYATSADALSGIDNVVAGGVCRNLTLTHLKEFYCPERFVAESATFVRYFNSCPNDGGFEIIWLPYSPTSISARVNGNDYESDLYWVGQGRHTESFWLRELKSSSRTGVITVGDASEFAAYTPYIIAMPGADFEDGSMDLSERPVTFHGSDVVVDVMPSAIVPKVSVAAGCYQIYGSAVRMQADDSLKFVFDNEGRAFEPLAKGGTVFPMTGYVARIPGDVGSNVNPVLEYYTETSIESVKDASMRVIAGKGRITIISGTDQTVAIYNVAGQAIRELRVNAGETVEELNAGIYFINNIKVMVF